MCGQVTIDEWRVSCDEEQAERHWAVQVKFDDNAAGVVIVEAGG